MATTTNDMIQAAMEYASYGWRVIPVDAKKKHPPLNEWQKLATTDEEQIAEWWEGRWKTCGIGVQFGPSSGIVDIEIDDLSAEPLLAKAFGGEIPPTPTFVSGTKGLPHRIFRFRADLPFQANLPLRKYNIAADFKIGSGERDGSLSVFPPSGKYRWLEGSEPSRLEPAELPDHFIAWLANETGLIGDGVGPKKKSVDEWSEILKGAGKGERHDSLLSVIGKIAHEWQDLTSKESVELIYALAIAQNDRNTPALPHEEVERMVVDMIKRERGRRAETAYNEISTPKTENAIKPAKNDTRFRLTIVESEPPEFLLFADDFAGAKGGCLTLTAEQFLSWPAVRVQGLKQANHCLPGGSHYMRAWQRKGGICEQLVATAERREASVDKKREAVIAQRILEHLDRARQAGDDDKPDSRGRPTRLADGSVVFHFNVIWDEIRYVADKITRGEVVDVLERYRATSYRPAIDGKKRRFFRVSAASLRDLDECAYRETTSIQEQK